MTSPGINCSGLHSLSHAVGGAELQNATLWHTCSQLSAKMPTQHFPNLAMKGRTNLGIAPPCSALYIEYSQRLGIPSCSQVHKIRSSIRFSENRTIRQVPSSRYCSFLK